MHIQSQLLRQPRWNEQSKLLRIIQGASGPRSSMCTSLCSVLLQVWMLGRQPSSWGQCATSSTQAGPLCAPFTSPPLTSLRLLMSCCCLREEGRWSSMGNWAASQRILSNTSWWVYALWSWLCHLQCLRMLCWCEAFDLIKYFKVSTSQVVTRMSTAVHQEVLTVCRCMWRIVIHQANLLSVVAIIWRPKKANCIVGAHSLQKETKTLQAHNWKVLSLPPNKKEEVTNLPVACLENFCLSFADWWALTM